MRLTGLNAYLMRMLYLVAAGIVVCQVFGRESLVSGLFAITFCLVLAIWFLVSLNRLDQTDLIALLVCAVAFAHVVLNAYFTQSALSFGYLKKYIMFAFSMLFFSTARKVCMDRQTKGFALNLGTALSVFLIVYYYLRPMEVYMLNFRVSNYLTFGFTNPNLTAMFILCLLGIEVLQCIHVKNRLLQLAHLAIAGALLYFIVETQSRNCLIVIAIIILMYLLLHKKNKVPGWVGGVVAIWPLVFAVCYLMFLESAWASRLFAFLITEGKQLDARISVWQPAVVYILESPVLGAYSQISEGTGASQMHNTHLDVLASYGTLPLLIFLFLLYRFADTGKELDTKSEQIAQYCFLGVIILGMAEAAVVSGGLGIYLWAGLFLMIKNGDRDEPKMNRARK